MNATTRSLVTITSEERSSPLFPDLERQGFRFELRGDQLKVRAPAGALDDSAVKRLRRQKPRLMAEVRLRDFVTLVRCYGADHGILLHRSAIAAELDAVAAADLASATRETRQAWAAAIAWRLTRPRIASWP
jgi:hypothetical protein